MELEIESSEDEDIIFVPKTAQKAEDKTGDEMPVKQEKPKKVEKMESTKAVSSSSLFFNI